jgi:hypothetical protein
MTFSMDKPFACRLLAVTALMCLAARVAAQQKPLPDSSGRDSAALVQYEVAQSYCQGKVDSMVRVRLESELQGLQANSQKSRELAAELQKIKAADSLRK